MIPAWIKEGLPSQGLSRGARRSLADASVRQDGPSLPSLPMTFLTAAEAVLKSARRPLTTREITELALNALIAPTGKTPEATMSATLNTAVRDDPLGTIQRDYRPGPTRAARDSVRWIWNGD